MACNHDDEEEMVFAISRESLEYTLAIFLPNYTISDIDEYILYIKANIERMLIKNEEMLISLAQEHLMRKLYRGNRTNTN